ncbi:MAG: ATP-binding protein [Panacagrimonas sp.]
MNQADNRPSPDQLLKDAQRAHRGKLKVFLGAAPGVGKTYAMLRAAQRERADGVEVCVGLIETHGRAETEAQLAGLELLPRARIEYRGRSFEELDVAAILRRRPQLVLVDEFAHSNIPGASHPKRHQDVEDLLEAGLDVWTTLNVQHLESLNDVVARITGVPVRETVPDEVLDQADEIELIDLPPEDLIRRLKEGKVYVPDQARQALGQFFGRGALTALRELALRAAAEHIDAEMLEFKARHAVDEPWPTRERLLVCINEQDVSQTVVRAARRIAEHRRIPWIAVHVITPRALGLDDRARDKVARNLRLAERLGADTVSVPGNDLVETLIELARARNATQIVVGRPQRRRLRMPWTKSIAVELMRRASPLEITVVTWEAPRASTGLSLQLPTRESLSWKPYAIATALSVATALLCFALERVLGVHSMGAVFLLTVLAVAVRLGLWPSLFASLLCSGLYNYLFTEPRFTLLVAQPDDLAAVVSFFIAALLAGNLGGRLRSQLDQLKTGTRQAYELAEFSRGLTAAAESREVVRATVEHLNATLMLESVVMQRGEEDRLIVQPGSSNQRPIPDIGHAAAQWAWTHDEAAGFGTDTLPASPWRFLPLSSARGRIGLLGVHLAARGRDADAAELRLLQSVAGLAAVALERTRLVADLESSRVATETEQLRAALLSSVSHDLRTPLVSVLGAAETLTGENGKLAESSRRELAAHILEEAERLNRFVQNLLDMTRLSYGKLVLRKDACDVHELLAGARKRIEKLLGGRVLNVSVAPDLPMIQADAMLVEQVLVNLLDNAIKYSPADQPVRIECRVEGAQLLVTVIDRGPGIPEADREKVFDMFYRVKQTDTRSAGTGLGLAICRGILAAHGGSIVALAGNDGVGTRMEVRLPTKVAEARAI